MEYAVLPNKKLVNILELYKIINENVIYSTDLEDNKVIYENLFDINFNIDNFNNDSKYEALIKLNNEEIISTTDINNENSFKIELGAEGKKEINIIIYKNNEEKVNFVKNVYYIEPYKTQFLEEETNKGIKLMYNKPAISDTDWDKTINLASKLGSTYIRVATKLILA